MTKKLGPSGCLDKATKLSPPCRRLLSLYRMPKNLWNNLFRLLDACRCVDPVSFFCLSKVSFPLDILGIENFQVIHIQLIMQECPKCSIFTMVKSCQDGKVIFKCPSVCGYQMEGSNKDRLIDSFSVRRDQATVSVYKDEIKWVAHDRTSKQVKMDCPNCGLDYMSQWVQKDLTAVYFACTCGQIMTK